MIIPVSGQVTGTPSYGHCEDHTQHEGLDIARVGSQSLTIVAAADGHVTKVTNSSSTTGFGTSVTVAHAGGYTTLYGHMVLNSVLVSVGQPVSQGQALGTMGSTGRSTGTHLHFELRLNGIVPTGWTDAYPCWSSVSRGAAINWTFPGLGITPAGAHVDQVYYDPAAATWRTGWTGNVVAGPSQVSAVYFSGTWPMAMYQKDGQLWQQYGTSAGWVNSWTGLQLGSGATISAVNMGGYQPQVMAIDNGLVYQIWADSNGWHKVSTGLQASGQIAATYIPGNAWPVSMVVDSGLLYKVWVDGGAWKKDYTGVGISGPMSAAYSGGSAPTVISQEGGLLYHSFVGTNGSWAKLYTGLGADGNVSAVQINGSAPDVIVSSAGQLYHVRYNGSSWQSLGSMGVPTTGVFSAVNVGSAYPQVINFTAAP